MMDLILRRRELMTPQDTGPKYAITKKSNPAQMAVCYNKGWAANPDYMTIEEANALYVSQTQLGRAFSGINKVDLREFTNFYYDNTWGFLYEYGYATTALLIVLPNRPFTQNAKGINFKNSGDKYIVIPPGVTTYWSNTVFYQQGTQTNRDCIVHFIVEGETPPVFGGNFVNGEYFNVANNTTLADIFVPDNAVEIYKQATGWSKYADIIKPMSQYVEPNL